MGITLPADVRAGSTVLLLPPRTEDTVDEACLRLLAGTEPRRRNVVALTFDRSAEVFVDTWIKCVGVKPADMSIVDVGTDGRSVTAESADPSLSRNVVRPVENPEDFATIRRHLEELLTEPITSDQTRLFYLDSLSAEHREVGPQATFSLLDDVSDLVRRTGCIGFVRVDRSVHSDYAINVMANLVDTALGLDMGTGGGSWTLRAGRRPLEGLSKGDSSISLDDLFELLSDRQRRLAVHCLSEAEGPLATFDLAMRIASIQSPNDDPPQDEALKRVYTGLVHVHIPKLEARGVVSADADGEAIRLRKSAEYLESLLTLMAPNDLHR